MKRLLRRLVWRLLWLKAARGLDRDIAWIERWANQDADEEAES